MYSIELIPTWPDKDGRYIRTTWLVEHDEMESMKTALCCSLWNDREIEEGIIIIKKVKYNL